MKKLKRVVAKNTQPVNTAARLFLVSPKSNSTTPSLAPFLCKACGKEFESKEACIAHKVQDHKHHLTKYTASRDH
jgi:hypothetical protein